MYNNNNLQIKFCVAKSNAAKVLLDETKLNF